MRDQPDMGKRTDTFRPARKSAPAVRWNPLARRLGEDPPASHVVRWVANRKLPVQRLKLPPRSDEDYTLIDLNLAIVAPETGERLATPQPGLGFAGLTPQQRYHFLEWLQYPRQPAPPAFQQLYLAHLEVRLLEKKETANEARDELLSLHEADDWSNNIWLQRTLLLAFWLAQDGPSLVRWLDTVRLSAELTSIALGFQALMQEPMQSHQLPNLMPAWSIADGHSLPPEFLDPPLHSLERTLQAPLLDHALEQLGDDARIHRPWRSVHRDLRIALPQPDLRPILEPLLVEIVDVAWVEMGDTSTGTQTQAHAPQDETEPDAPHWQLILEFGQSRSEYYDFTLNLMQRLPTYAQLMDENRTLVNRALFRRSEIRHFWRIWEYVQSWSTTRVYLNGEELEKWQVWPYSQYMR